jgi:hypothetical protein
MAYHFLRGDRGQPFLLPPDLRDWLPQDHLAWFVRDVVAQLDLAPFLCAYRADGHGHPAYDPKTLLGVLLYAYATGVRSSRQIQRRCIEDLAFRVLAGNQLPDHVNDRPVPGPPSAGPGWVPGRVLESCAPQPAGASGRDRPGRHHGGRQRRRPRQLHPGQAGSGGCRDPASGSRG